MRYRFLIYISYSYAIPVGDPLEDEIKKRDYEVKWFADLDDGKRAIAHKANALFYIKDALDYAPHIILTITDSVPDFFDALKVQVFHGFNAEKRPSSKHKFAHFRLRGFFDLYCTQGPSTTIEFKRLERLHKYFTTIETGWPKMDPLFPISHQEPSAKPTVMIASTFTERLSLAHNSKVFNEIKRLSESDVYNFITVLHPKLPNTVVDKWKSLENHNFTYVDTTDLIPLYQKADIMFADTTSAIQEFLLQEKPVVTYNHTFDQNYLLNITETNSIESAINKALSRPKALIDHIKNYIKELHPYTDGKSSERVIDASIIYLHQDKSHLNRKPLNLVRKFKMRKRLNYYTLNSYNKPFTLTKDA